MRFVSDAAIFCCKKFMGLISVGLLGVPSSSTSTSLMSGSFFCDGGDRGESLSAGAGEGSLADTGALAVAREEVTASLVTVSTAWLFVIASLAAGLPGITIFFSRRGGDFCFLGVEGADFLAGSGDLLSWRFGEAAPFGFNRIGGFRGVGCFTYSGSSESMVKSVFGSSAGSAFRLKDLTVSADSAG